MGTAPLHRGWCSIPPPLEVQLINNSVPPTPTRPPAPSLGIGSWPGSPSTTVCESRGQSLAAELRCVEGFTDVKPHLKSTWNKSLTSVARPCTRWPSSPEQSGKRAPQPLPAGVGLPFPTPGHLQTSAQAGEGMGTALCHPTLFIGSAACLSLSLSVGISCGAPGGNGQHMRTPALLQQPQPTWLLLF